MRNNGGYVLKKFSALLIVFVLFGLLGVSFASSSNNNNNKYPPVFNDREKLPDATTGKSYSYEFSVNGSGNITFSIKYGRLPRGLELRWGEIRGTPTEAGDFTFTITAKNSAGSASQKFRLKVKAVKPKISGSLKKGTVGQSYRDYLSVEGSEPITWRVDSKLPRGITFSEGVFSGKPLESWNGYITVRATNSAGYDQKRIKLTINYPAGSKYKNKKKK